MLRLKQQFYDQREKPGRLLAWRIKQQESERAITSIEDENGNMTVDPREINEAFRKFYEKLYCSEYKATTDAHSAFFGNLNIPKISEELKFKLDGEITAAEIMEAINTLKGGKTAGPDGLPIDLYKYFSDKMVKPLHDMYIECYNSACLPTSMRKSDHSFTKTRKTEYKVWKYATY